METLNKINFMSKSRFDSATDLSESDIHFVEMPLPSISDSSDTFATTGWFNSKIQVVSTLPANPDENIYYFVRS